MRHAGSLSKQSVKAAPTSGSDARRFKLGWQERYFALVGTRFVYFDSADCRRLVRTASFDDGLIIPLTNDGLALDGASARDGGSASDRASETTWMLCTDRASYRLEARSALDMLQWEAALHASWALSRPLRFIERSLCANQNEFAAVAARSGIELCMRVKASTGSAAQLFRKAVLSIDRIGGRFFWAPDGDSDAATVMCIRNSLVFEIGHECSLSPLAGSKEPLSVAAFSRPFLVASLDAPTLEFRVAVSSSEYEVAAARHQWMSYIASLIATAQRFAPSAEWTAVGASISSIAHLPSIQHQQQQQQHQQPSASSQSVSFQMQRAHENARSIRDGGSMSLSDHRTVWMAAFGVLAPASPDSNTATTASAQLHSTSRSALRPLTARDPSSFAATSAIDLQADADPAAAAGFERASQPAFARARDLLALYTRVASRVDCGAGTIVATFAGACARNCHRHERDSLVKNQSSTFGGGGGFVNTIADVSMVSVDQFDTEDASQSVSAASSLSAPSASSATSSSVVGSDDSLCADCDCAALQTLMDDAAFVLVSFRFDHPAVDFSPTAQAFIVACLRAGFSRAGAFAMLSTALQRSNRVRVGNQQTDAQNSATYLMLSPRRLAASFFVFAALFERYFPALHAQWAALGVFAVGSGFTSDALENASASASSSQHGGTASVSSPPVAVLFRWWWSVVESLWSGWLCEAVRMFCLDQYFIEGDTALFRVMLAVIQANYTTLHSAKYVR